MKDYLEKSSVYQDAFDIMQDILQNAFQIKTFYYKSPYNEMHNIEPYIQTILWPNLSMLDSQFALTSDKDIFVIKTNVEFYVIFIYLTKDIPPDIIGIGPFRTNELSLEDLSLKFAELHLAPEMENLLMSYYENLPCVSLTNITDTITYILKTFFPETTNLVPSYIDYAKPEYYQFEKPKITSTNIEEVAIKANQWILNFIDTMFKGNKEECLVLYKHMLQKINPFPSGNHYLCKRNLHLINNTFHISLLRTHINPLQTTRVYLFLTEKIERVYTRDDVIKVSQEIYHRYYSLCQNTTLPEYSKTVNDVINYIHAHLEEPLHLSGIAKQLNKNASALSSSFTQNTGMTITNYIRQARINKAVQYFNTTKMTISEVALAVGFQDFAYFSRLFKKQMGCSPKEYRNKQLNK